MSGDPVAQAPFRPRNLVMLSDGTGNSAAKLFRTNVWRIYEALDLNCDEQIALYDDGVGTASFKPLALLGGAPLHSAAGGISMGEPDAGIRHR